MRHILTLILTFAAFLLLLAGCESDKTDSRLHRVADIVSDSPKAALDSLAVIDRNSLNEADRHYYDFLSIKAGDKDFTRQPNDSLILSVLNYYSSHKDENIYPEVLYYCGRVYSDLGDVPTALDYFHKVLELCENDKKFEKLYVTTLAQCAYLMSYIRMYDEAINCLEKAIEMDLKQTPVDSLNLFHDLTILGETWMRADNFQKADSICQVALAYSETVPKNKLVGCLSILANINLHLKNNEKAYAYLTLSKNQSGEKNRNYILITEADLHIQKQEYDSAYIIADRIIHNQDPKQRREAYRLILTPELRKFVPADSLFVYLDRFKNLLYEYYSDNDRQMTIYQQSLFNYTFHKKNAEVSRQQLSYLWIFLIILLIAGLIFGTFHIFRRIRYKKTVERLKEALDIILLLKGSEADLKKRVDELTLLLDKESQFNRKLLTNIGDHTNKSDKATEASDLSSGLSIREELRNKLVQLNNELLDNNNKIKPPESILKSNVYLTISKTLAKNALIPESSEIWNKLLTEIEITSPLFEERVTLLVGGNLSIHEFQTIMLIKCGFGTSEIAILQGREANTISSRKTAIASRIFEKKMSARGLDGIIRLM